MSGQPSRRLWVLASGLAWDCRWRVNFSAISDGTGKPDRHIIRLPVTAAHPRIGHGRNPRVPQSLCRLGDCSTRLECSTRHMLTQHPPDWVTDRPVGQLVRAKHFLYWPTSGWLSGNAID